MKAYRFAKFGLENLQPEDLEVAELKEDEILIDIKCTSLNYRDLLMVKGQYNARLKMPIVPLSDAVGTVAAIGSKVQDFAVGQRVSPVFAQNWQGSDVPADVFQHTLGGPLDGTLCQQIIIPASAAVKVPDYLSNQEAATLPCAALTAFNSLVTFGNLQPGQTVLVQGTGGVSLFALQMAKALGATVIATSSSDEKLAICEKLGADHVINYKAISEWHKEARKLTDGVGVDQVVEVGGAGTLEKSIKAVKNGGFIGLIGILAGSNKDFNLLPLLMRNICVQGVLVGSRDSFLAMNDFLAKHKIRPHVDSVFAFDHAREAFDKLASGSHMGKICIEVS